MKRNNNGLSLWTNQNIRVGVRISITNLNFYRIFLKNKIARNLKNILYEPEYEEVIMSSVLPPQPLVLALTVFP